MMTRFFLAIWFMVRLFFGVIGAAGRVLVALVGIAGIVTAVAANSSYFATVPGSGTSFASALISGLQYAQFIICDATNGQANCAAIGAGNSASTTAQALTVADPNVLSALTTGLGSPTDVPCTLPATTASCSDIAVAKAQANTLNSPGAISQTTQGTTNGVTNGANNTNTIAASATAQILSATSGGTTGATGDYLTFCEIMPATTSPGAVTISDNATTIYSFAGGASSVSNLVSWPVPFGAPSKSGGWKVTTGTNVSVFCVGKFS
jgi:hypothetical protein